MTTRIEDRFRALKAADRPAFVTFLMAGDPDGETALRIMKGLPGAGADLIELGMPFSDPMADGPAIQRAGLRALKGGETLAHTLETVRRFREGDRETPVILMGYFNPIYVFGVERFVEKAGEAGVDGLIVVDLPPEMDDELCLPAIRGGLNFIRLATPTTDERRLPAVLENTSGFVYYVSINGITGSAAPDAAMVGGAVQRLRGSTDLPICVGFGVRTPEQAAAIGGAADGVVVGSALVAAIENTLDEGRATERTVEMVLSLVGELAEGVRGARAAAG